MAKEQSEEKDKQKCYITPEIASLLPKQQVELLLRVYLPGFELESKAEQLVQEHTHQFLDKLLEFAHRIADHRGSKLCEEKDVILAARSLWKLEIPPSEKEQPVTNVAPTDQNGPGSSAGENMNTAKEQEKQVGTEGASL